MAMSDGKAFGCLGGKAVVGRVSMRRPSSGEPTVGLGATLSYYLFAASLGERAPDLDHRFTIGAKGVASKNPRTEASEEQG